MRPALRVHEKPEIGCFLKPGRVALRVRLAHALARPTDPMSSHSFSWCTKCGFILAAVEMPPVGATVGVVLVYTNATNPQFPMPVVRMGVSLKRFNDLVFVSNADGTIVPASAVVAWRPWSSPPRTPAPRRGLELHGEAA